MIKLVLSQQIVILIEKFINFIKINLMINRIIIKNI